MNFKRPLEGSGPSDRVPKRRLARSSSVFINANSFPEESVNRIVGLVREVVREELDRIIPIILGSTSRFFNNPVQSNAEAHLTLQFITKLPEIVYTGNKIQADGNSRVSIELVDSRIGSRVTTGPLSSLKIDIVALEGDFDPENSNSNFNEKVVVERQGHRPILNGDLTVTLTQGLGCLENVTVTDNSSWIPCGRFRLGARVSPKNRVEEQVREASSNVFRVKDNRGQPNGKHHPPNQNSEVWRLEKIAKGGIYCVRLASIGIQTVMDFRRLQEINPSLLKKTLGGNGNEISDGIWETIVGHAADCKIDDNEMFTYSSPWSPNLELLFDQFYRLKGATFDGHEYCPIEKLNAHQTILVQNLKQQAFENLNQLTPVNIWQLPLADRFLGQQDISTLLEFGSTSASTFCYEAPESHFSEDSGAQIYNPENLHPQTVTGNFSSADNDNQRLHGANNFGPCTTFADQNGPQVHVSVDFPSNLWWMPEDFDGLLLDDPELGYFTSSASNRTFCMGLSNEAGPSFNVYIHNRARSRVAWSKIRAAFKWRTVRRNLATKRNLAATRQQVSCV